MCSTHLTGKVRAFSGLPCEKGELLVEHQKETSHGVVLFDPLPFSNILFIFSIEAQNIGVQPWTPWVMPQNTSLLRYEVITIHPLSPSYFKFFSLCLFLTRFFLAYVVYIDKKLALCVSRRVLIFFFFLIISIFVSFPRTRITQNTYKKSISLTSVFPSLTRPVDLPIHLKQLLTVIIEKKTSL